ncbi:bacterio-opsin activator domain-containing protein [Haloplanus halobius]|uniref:bacterio-opsin activator domain-containing protein n=1 Tax=Haloplanus halobius TaxID=2934938 RepID=UPI00200E6FA7|nr:bacterio-opsin activator domain-containing protein [Haloplanus sp. XH21]
MNNKPQVGGDVETRTGQPSVLIVDDDEDVADTYALWLRDDHDVHIAYSGEEALETIDDDIDIVLLDRRMPNMPGDEVLERIREQDVDCQVSMLTAVKPEQTILDLPFDEYLVKPVTKSELSGVVEELQLREQMGEDTQEYLALQSTAETIEGHENDGSIESSDVERLKEEIEAAGTDQTVQEEAAELEQLKTLNELIRSVNQTVVDVSTEVELSREICDRFVENTPYDLAIVGEYVETYDEFLPNAVSGRSDADIDPVTCPEGGAIREAIDTEDIRVVDLDAASDRPIDRLQAALGTDWTPQTAVVIPINYRQTIRGAMVAWSSEPMPLSDRYRSTLHDVGTTLGNAIDSIQTRQLVDTDTVVELELQITARSDVFVDLSAEYDCRIDLDGIHLSSDGGITCYLTVAGRSASEVTPRLVESDGVDDCRVIDDRGADCLLECTLHDASIALTLSETSGSITKFFVDGGEGYVRLEFAPDVNLRSVLKAIQDEFDDVDLVSKRNTDRSYQSVEGFRGSLAEKLTERQDTVISAAFNAGYFDWPRDSTAEEVAEGLGLAPPTFHEHLREAERKLVEVYLEETE